MDFFILKIKNIIIFQKMDKEVSIRHDFERNLSKGFETFGDICRILQFCFGFIYYTGGQIISDGQIKQKLFIRKDGFKYRFVISYIFDIYKPASNYQSVCIDYCFGFEQIKRVFLTFKIDKIKDLCKRINDNYDEYNK